MATFNALKKTPFMCSKNANKYCELHIEASIL